LRHAIEHDEFEVHYQPKVDAEGRIIGVEALARWSHDEYGSVSPERFIPIAEETGMILPLTTSILRRAFADAWDWNRASAAPVRMAVNLSPRLFLGDDIVSHVAGLL